MNKALLVSALASHAAYAIKNCISPREEPEMTTLSKEDVVRWAEECVFDIMQADEYHAENEVIGSGNRWITDKMMTFATLSRADIVEANKALVAENERLKRSNSSYANLTKAQECQLTSLRLRLYELKGADKLIDSERAANATLTEELATTRTALAAAEAREEKLKSVLQRIISYYDLSKTGSSLPSLTVQAKAEHENTMFGEARKILCKEVKYHLPDDISECGISC